MHIHVADSKPHLLIEIIFCRKEDSSFFFLNALLFIPTVAKIWLITHTP